MLRATEGATVSVVIATVAVSAALPYASTARANSTRRPSGRMLALIDQVPPAAMVVPRTVGPSRNVPVAPVSAVPLTVGVGSFVVEPPEVMATAGGVRSTVITTDDEVPALPAASVAVATRVWAPSARAVASKLHVPLIAAMALPLRAVGRQPRPRPCR